MPVLTRLKNRIHFEINYSATAPQYSFLGLFLALERGVNSLVFELQLVLLVRIFQHPGYKGLSEVCPRQ